MYILAIGIKHTQIGATLTSETLPPCPETSPIVSQLFISLGAQILSTVVKLRMSLGGRCGGGNSAVG